MTLESQYKQYLEQHPESTFTFEEWKTWFGLKIKEAFKNKILCHKHGTMYQIHEPCPKCLEEKNN